MKSKTTSASVFLVANAEEKSKRRPPLSALSEGHRRFIRSETHEIREGSRAVGGSGNKQKFFDSRTPREMTWLDVLAQLVREGRKKRGP